MSRPINAIPLDPAILAAEGAVNPIPPADASFDPSGEWDHTYRIVGSRGYQTEHHTVGWLRIRRQSPQGSRFSLQIDERILGDRGTESRQSISIGCLDDPWGTPEHWTRHCSFLDTRGETEEDLVIEQRGRAENGSLEIRQAGNATKLRIHGPWTTQFNILEAVQRRHLNPDASPHFELLEDFSLVKPGHLLARAESAEADLSGIGLQRLGRFVGLGRGILPFDYYLDGHHRFIFAISMNKSFILDHRDHAERMVDEALERERNRLRRS